MVSSARRSPLAALFLTVFLDLLGFGMVLPVLALYAERFHVGDVAITALVATYSLMQLFFAPIWGRVSDRFGRRPVLLVSILGSCLSQLGYALSPGFAGLVAARAFAGVCGANISAAQAYVADSTDEKSRAAGMGLLGAAFGLGFVLGPAFGGFLAHYDPRLPFAVASALAACNFALAWRTLVEPRSRQSLDGRPRTPSRTLTWSALARTLATPRLRVLIGLYFVVTFGFAQLEGTFPLYLQRRFGYDERHVGYVFAFIGVVMIIVQGGLVRRLVPRLGERRLVVAGTLLMAAGLLLCWNAHHLAWLAVAATLLAIGNGLNTPSLSSLISRTAGDDRQGGVLGASQSFGALARITGPIVGGVLLGYGEGAPYLVAAAILSAACLYAWALVRQPAAAVETATPLDEPSLELDQPA